MKIIIQRVTKAKVWLTAKEIGGIGQGLVLLVGIGQNDQAKDVKKMAQKITNLRLFADNFGKMNLSLKYIQGEVMVIPQFTLFAQLKGQNRPYFGKAAQPKPAQKLFNQFVIDLKELGVRKVVRGEFGAYMQVELTNDGPVTLVFDSNEI